MRQSLNDSGIKQAVEFVVRRVEEQGYREDELIDCTERLLLENPPSAYFGLNIASVDSGPVMPDNELARIVRLVISAHEHDEVSDSEMELRWKIAAIVLKMAGHPVSQLLEAADIKPQVDLPRWDKWLLWFSALAVTSISLSITILTDSELSGAIAFFMQLGIIYFIIRRREQHYLERAAEKYRQALSHPI